jgi:hypothetical protein
MASSRWKRFAFFERQALQLDNDVLDDLIPGGADSNSVRSAQAGSSLSSAESISMAVTTAALPSYAVILQQQQQQSNALSNTAARDDPVSSMWASLSACHESGASSSAVVDSASIQLPSQGQSSLHQRTKPQHTATSVLDGLVLAFCGSSECARIHCFDITLRCNPTEKSSYEDKDGWRGYLPLDSCLTGGPLLGLASCRLTGNNSGQHPTNTMLSFWKIRICISRAPSR